MIPESDFICEEHGKSEFIIACGECYKKLKAENEELIGEVGKLQDFTSWLWSGCFGHIENIRGNIVDIYEDWERGKFDRKKKEQSSDE